MKRAPCQTSRGGKGSGWDWLSWVPDLGVPWQLIVIIQLWLLTGLVVSIVIWLGYCMITSPAPVSLEDLEAKLEEETAMES